MSVIEEGYDKKVREQVQAIAYQPDRRDGDDTMPMPPSDNPLGALLMRLTGEQMVLTELVLALAADIWTRERVEEWRKQARGTVQNMPGQGYDKAGEQAHVDAVAAVLTGYISARQ